MADLLSTIRAEIEARMRELEPALAEYESLMAAADALLAEGRGAPAAGDATPGGEAGLAATSRRTATGVRTGRPRRGRAPARGRTPAASRTARAERGARRGGGRPADSPQAQAILAALEHGSHTVAELVVVTAIPATEIRESVRRLRAAGAIARTEREGRSAYALPGLDA